MYPLQEETREPLPLGVQAVAAHLRHFDQIIAACQQAADLSSKLLTFSRQGRSESRPGEGTTFRLFFPLEEGSRPPGLRARKPAPPPAPCAH